MPPRKKTTTKVAAKVGEIKKKKVVRKKTAPLRRVTKKVNTKPQPFGVIMFEPKETKIDLNPINISIVKHPLDQYFSPHLLDLSSKRYIERVKSTLDSNNQISYSELPAGQTLEKLQIFEFLAIENSEILNFIRYFWRNSSRFIVGSFRRVDLTPKLPLSSSGKVKFKASSLDVWQEVSVINFIIFIVSEIRLLASAIKQLTWYIYTSLVGQYLGRDEIVRFESKVIPTSIASNNPDNGLEILRPSEIFKAPQPRVRLKMPTISLPDFLNFQGFERIKISIGPLVSFIIAALFIVIPISSYYYVKGADEVKGKVLGQAEQALFGLTQAKADLADFNFSSAENHLIEANQNFVSAQNQLGDIKSVLTILADTLPLNNTYRSGKNLLELGEKLTKSGEYLISGLSQLTDDSDLSLVSRAKNFKFDIGLALAELESSQENFDKIKLSHLPEEHRDTFLTLKNNLPVFANSLKKSDEMVNFAIDFLGDGGLKKYLVVFQNDNELRATGGFMGSFALVDFKGGDIAGIKMPGGGTYDVRAGFKKLLAAPEPMRLINSRWEFQDANWWPDFPTSAENIKYFYNKSDGATIDGVITINSDWLGDLLSVVGDIPMPEYDKVITADNFENELQRAVEIEYEDEKQPKKILGDLAPKLIEKIFDVEPDAMMDLVSTLNTGLKTKDIMIYLFDENDQQFVSDNNWDGRIKESGKDYLSVIATNINGGKTDGIVEQNIYHQASILDDGSVIDSLLINRSHFGPTDQEFTNRSNRSYLRVYVPLGSQLISASGFTRPPDSEFKELDDYLEEDSRLDNEKNAVIDSQSLTRIYTENGKTVYGNWLTIEPGQSQEVLLVYQLPFKVDVNTTKKVESGFLNKIRATFSVGATYDSYSLLVQKQSGSNDGEFSSIVNYPVGIDPYITYPSEVKSTDSNSQYSNTLSEDLFFFIGLKKDIIN